MEMNDMVIISVDDHISEPPTMFDKHLSGADLASAPKLRTATSSSWPLRTRLIGPPPTELPMRSA